MKTYFVLIVALWLSSAGLAVKLILSFISPETYFFLIPEKIWTLLTLLGWSFLGHKFLQSIIYDTHPFKD